MLVAGIREKGGPVETLTLDDPRALRPDEVLIEVKAAGVGNWDDIVRAGGWDVGVTTPMALGVEAAGTVVAVGEGVRGFEPGDSVLCHCAPLSEQGAWAERFIAPAGMLARKPANVSWAIAGALPVPGLTAEQVLTEVLGLRAGETLLVHGAGGVTGGLIVQLASHRGVAVIATASRRSASRVKSFGAREVLDYGDADWPDQVCSLDDGKGVSFVVNAARGGSATAIRAAADGARFATITSDPPEQERGISVTDVYVRPDASQLQRVTDLLGDGKLQLPIAATHSLTDAAAALANVVAGGLGGAVVVTP